MQTHFPHSSTHSESQKHSPASQLILKTTSGYLRLHGIKSKALKKSCAKIIGYGVSAHWLSAMRSANSQAGKKYPLPCIHPGSALSAGMVKTGMMELVYLSTHQGLKAWHQAEQASTHANRFHRSSDSIHNTSRIMLCLFAATIIGMIDKKLSDSLQADSQNEAQSPADSMNLLDMMRFSVDLFFVSKALYELKKDEQLPQHSANHGEQKGSLFQNPYVYYGLITGVLDFIHAHNNRADTVLMKECLSSLIAYTAVGAGSELLAKKVTDKIHSVLNG